MKWKLFCVVAMLFSASFTASWILRLGDSPLAAHCWITVGLLTLGLIAADLGRTK